MGIFSKLFGSLSPLEKQLEDLYVPMFQMMGMSSSEAINTFCGILKKAKEESLKEGTSNLPQNFGEILLEKESTDEKIKTMLAKKRKEGVRDHDIRWWWNMHDLERRMMLMHDDVTKLAGFRKYTEEDSTNSDEAAKRIRKYFPVYGDPDDATHTTGEDRPLPFELKDRINIYFEKRSQRDSAKLKQEIEEASSLNALIRKEIKKGNI